MGQIDLDGSNSTLKADVIRGQASTTVKLGGLLDTDGNYIQTEKGGDIASASPLVIDTDGDYFDVTGTTNFAAMTVAADRQFTLQFDGALTMTHHATNLDLPGEANITTAAGDVAIFQSTGADTVQCINYTRADGTGIVSAGGTNTPMLYVEKNGAQAITTATTTQITTWTEIIDTESSFASDAWTPQTAGTYLLFGQVQMSTVGDGKTVTVGFQKNSVVHKTTKMHTGVESTLAVNLTTIVEANGTTDDFFITALHDHGSNRNAGPAVAATYWGGFLLIPA